MGVLCINSLSMGIRTLNWVLAVEIGCGAVHLRGGGGWQDGQASWIPDWVKGRSHVAGRALSWVLVRFGTESNRLA